MCVDLARRRHGDKPPVSILKLRKSVAEGPFRGSLRGLRWALARRLNMLGRACRRRHVVLLSARASSIAEMRLFGTRWSPVMSSTFETVAEIIADTCDLPIEEVTPESHAIDDLGIDSLDFLDVAFAIDKAFGINLPLEQWTEEVNVGKTPAEQYFVLGNLGSRIEVLVAAKPC
jgi:acyl carrier protein